MGDLPELSRETLLALPKERLVAIILFQAEMIASSDGDHQPFGKTGYGTGNPAQCQFQQFQQATLFGQPLCQTENKGQRHKG